MMEWWGWLLVGAAGGLGMLVLGALMGCVRSSQLSREEEEAECAAYRQRHCGRGGGEAA